jgi:hypothetical protein
MRGAMLHRSATQLCCRRRRQQQQQQQQLVSVGVMVHPHHPTACAAPAQLVSVGVMALGSPSMSQAVVRRCAVPLHAVGPSIRGYR